MATKLHNIVLQQILPGKTPTFEKKNCHYFTNEVPWMDVLHKSQSHVAGVDMKTPRFIATLYTVNKDKGGGRRGRVL